MSSRLPDQSWQQLVQDLRPKENIVYRRGEATEHLQLSRHHWYRMCLVCPPLSFHRLVWVALSGAESRIRTNISFQTKLLCQIIDYSLEFQLVQFHHDQNNVQKRKWPQDPQAPSPCWGFCPESTSIHCHNHPHTEMLDGCAVHRRQMHGIVMSHHMLQNSRMLSAMTPSPLLTCPGSRQHFDISKKWRFPSLKWTSKCHLWKWPGHQAGRRGS